MLTVAIVGAGISGLTLAIFLRHLGFSVVVYERNASLSEVGAGVQIPPNACAQLAKVPGLLTKLRAAAFEPKQTKLQRYNDSKVLLALPGAPYIEARMGFPYLIVHRPQYQRILYETAIALGAEVTFDAQIVELDQEAPALIFARSPHRRAFDLIVGADGVNSFCRRCIASRPAEASPVITSRRAYRALLPIEVVKSTQYGERLVESRSVINWLGPQRHIVAYPVSDKHLNLVLVHPGPEEIGSWDQIARMDEVKETYADFDPDLQLLLSRVTDFRAWNILETPMLRRWGTVDGKIVLLGDAAHAMVPYMAQGAAQAVEDAAVLANCLHRMASALGLQRVLDSFEKLRRPRVARIVEASRMNGQVWELEDGPGQERRDRAWTAGATSPSSKRDGAGESSTQDAPVHERPTDMAPRVDAQTEPQIGTSASDFRRWLWGLDVSAEVDAYATSLGLQVDGARRCDKRL